MVSVFTSFCKRIFAFLNKPLTADFLGWWRVSFTLLLVFNYIDRQIHYKEYYTDAGWLPKATLLAVEKSESAHSFAKYFIFNDTTGYLLHLLFLICLLVLATGRAHRAFAVITFLLHTLFQNRNPYIVYGFDQFTTVGLFFMMFLPLNTPPTLKKKTELLGGVLHEPYNWVLVAFRLHIAVAYFHIGLSKFRGITWADGTALWYIFSTPTFHTFDMSWLKDYPLLLKIGAYSTLTYEILFPIAVFSKSSRNIFVAFGMVFHLGIALLMGLPEFGVLMMSMILIFAEKPRLPAKWRS